MALDRAWFNPVILNPKALPALLHPVPKDNPHRTDVVVDEGPYGTHDEFMACPPKVPHNLRNDDIDKSMPRWTIKEPLDPLVTFKLLNTAHLRVCPHFHHVLLITHEGRI